MAGDRRSDGTPRRVARDEARPALPPGAPAHASPPVANRGAVSYTDSEGARWSVREVEARRADGTPGHCLIFESSHAIRRVWTYPDDWPALQPSALEALSWGR